MTAAGFEVAATEEAVIYSNETAVYTFTVTNSGVNDERIELVLGLDPKWSFETDPISYLSGFTVHAGESLTFSLLINPISEYISSGKYIISIPIGSDTGEEKISDIVLYVRNLNALTGYLPSLNFILDAQEHIDPRQPQKVRLDVVNRNPLNITSLKVILQSDLYNASQTTALEPLGTASVVFEIQYDPQQPPTTDTLELTVIVGEKMFNPIKKQIEIISYADIVEVQYPFSGLFFETIEKVEYTNNGNADTTKQFTYPVTRWSQYFTSTIPEGKIIEKQGLLYYTTTVLLPAGVPITVTYSVNYRPVIWFLFLLSALVACYYRLRSPIVVKKEVVTLSVGKDGHTKFKILLHIKNRSLYLVDDVEIQDKIPAVAEIEKHFEVGTVKPEKILKHEKAGTVMHWHIPHLEAYEERIVTYKLYSIYQIVGNFRLPGAIIRFKGRKQQPIKITSNSVRVGKKMEDE